MDYELTEPIEGLGETKRQLASIQKIRKLRPIPGADFILVAEVLGWECIVKKDEFREGDLVVYFEVDSILPQRPEFEFMRERKFRVKTIKLKKQISQGLVMPLSVVPKALDRSGMYYEGDDVTELLGVTKFDLQAKAERDALMALENQMRQTKIPKWLMNISAFRYIYFKLNPKIKGNWPSWIQKTDESRIQSSARKLMEHYDKAWYVTEKLDGCLHEDTIIETKNSGFKSIKEICKCIENKESIFVSSYNIDKEKIEWKKVSGFQILENNDDWYEIETKDGEKITLTGEHLVFLPELKCWRKVSEFTGNEKILLKKKE